VFFAAGEEAEKKVQSVGGGGRMGRREEEEELELRLQTRERVQYVGMMHRGVPNDENPTVEVLYSRQSHTWRTHALSVALVIQTCWLVLRPT